MAKPQIRSQANYSTLSSRSKCPATVFAKRIFANKHTALYQNSNKNRCSFELPNTRHKPQWYYFPVVASQISVTLLFHTWLDIPHSLLTSKVLIQFPTIFIWKILLLQTFVTHSVHRTLIFRNIFLIFNKLIFLFSVSWLLNRFALIFTFFTDFQLNFEDNKFYI